jgi:hypothetical protein
LVFARLRSASGSKSRRRVPERNLCGLYWEQRKIESWPNGSNFRIYPELEEGTWYLSLDVNIITDAGQASYVVRGYTLMVWSYGQGCPDD